MRRQDWVAITIEFVIVVGGVYAAFELDRWREADSDRRANEAFVSLLAEELGEKLPPVRTGVENYRQLKDEQAAVIAWLNSGEPAAGFTAGMCFAAFRSLVLDWSAARLETVQFMATGDWARSVQDVELRRLLVALSSLQDRADAQFARFVSQIVNISDLYPDLIRRADSGPGRYRDNLECDAEGMRASQAFKNQLFGNIGRQTALLTYREDELELLETIAARLEALPR